MNRKAHQKAYQSPPPTGDRQHHHNWDDLDSLIATEPEPWREGADVASVDVVPPEKGSSVRKLTRGGTHFRFRYPLITTGHSAFCESLHEVNLMRCLDACPKATGIVEQPYWIHYEMNGERRKHAPDAFVVYGNRHVIFEVKIRRDAESPEVRERTRLLTPALARLGYVYRVITDELISRQPRLRNVEWLLRRARFPVSLSLKSEILGYVADATQPVTWQSLSAQSWELPAARLVLEGRLAVDLHEALSANSTVELIEGGEHGQRLY